MCSVVAYHTAPDYGAWLHIQPAARFYTPLRFLPAAAAATAAAVAAAVAAAASVAAAACATASTVCSFLPWPFLFQAVH